ncbi:AraC family transcriptional regulator [Pseudomonas chlororaphis subsp. aurantiaca]|uniref:helix-turn-helix domain-containing protein n=1 Tax=Pseudomonas chlororaphis TaxID=587753 RepID=UPI0027DBAC07|nr:AraC family transcriptional regulator [Pseudomonas chlororaphis]WMI97570.1 AraC family transcriptional regulator [Pseudomonas chlororaphis subsp. aurantiaca]
MQRVQQCQGGQFDLGGLRYDLETTLEAESSIWDFGRVDKIQIQGDHLVQLKRDSHSLVFFSQGENQHGHARIDGKRVPHGGKLQGKIDIIPKGSEFTSTYRGGYFSAAVMSIEPRLAELLPSYQGVLEIKPYLQLNDNLMRMMCEQFIHVSDPLLQESMLMTLLVYMSRKSFEPQVGAGFNLARKTKLIDYVEEKLEGPISIGQLANEVGGSVFHFLRVFKLSFGITPYQYILQRRVERARILLSHTDHSIEIVGFKCGFSSSSKFSQTFSRIAGTSPSAFRKSLASNGGRCQSVRS